MLFGKINNSLFQIIICAALISCSASDSVKYSDIIEYKFGDRIDAYIGKELSLLDKEMLENDIIAYLKINDKYKPDSRRAYIATSSFSISFQYYPNYRERVKIEDEKEIWLAARNSNRFIILYNKNIRIPVVFHNPDVFFTDTIPGFNPKFILSPVFTIYINDLNDFYVPKGKSSKDFIYSLKKGDYELIEEDYRN